MGLSTHPVHQNLTSVNGVGETITGLSLHPFALTLRHVQRSKGIHRYKTGFDKLTRTVFKSEAKVLNKQVCC